MASVQLLEGTRLLARVRAPVAAGGAIVPMEVSFSEPGPHLIEATPKLTMTSSQRTTRCCAN
jgi:hypothetical protein